MPDTILSTFLSLRATSPHHRTLTLVDEQGRDEAWLTVGDLGAAADRVVAALRAWGFVPGDRMLLVYPSSLEFAAALLGCLAAGVVPIPAHPPNPFRLAQDLATLTTTATGARGALTTSAYDRSRMAAAGQDGAPAWPSLRWYRTDTAPEPTGPVPWYQPDPDDPALIDPDGATVTHVKLAHRIASHVADQGLDADARTVHWAPEYHDTGLTSTILATIVSDAQTTLLTPATFLRRPAVWFDVLSRVRATHTAAPGFAFTHALRETTAEQRLAWDLSALRVVTPASEPDDPTTLPVFAAAFASTGLRYTARVNVGERL